MDIKKRPEASSFRWYIIPLPFLALAVLVIALWALYETPTDGSWTGTTDKGYPVSFTVSGSGTQWSNFKFKHDLKCTHYGVSGTAEHTTAGPGAISGGQFSVTGTIGFTGAFNTATTASGTYSLTNWAWTVSLPSPPYVHICYVTVSGTWTATTSGPPSEAPDFLIPFGSLDNGNANIANIGSSPANVTLKLRTTSGQVTKQVNFTIPSKGVIKTWDKIGNVYDYGKPVTVEVSGDQTLIGDNIKWAGPPYDTVGAGFTCGNLDLAKGKEFYFPFTSFGGWAYGYCVIANPAESATASGTIDVFDSAGIQKKSGAFSVGPKGVVRGWDIIGSIQEIADPALIRVSVNNDVVVEAVRWEQNRRGWGFAVFPSSKAGGTQFIIPFGSLDNGNVNLGNISGSMAYVTMKVMSGTTVLKEDNFAIPAKGVVRSWDRIGNIYNYGKPVQVEITSDQPLVGDNIKWASPPFDTVAAGFSCGPLSLAKGKEFYFPYSSFSSWTNAYCVMANTTNSSATVTLEVYDGAGVWKKTIVQPIGPRGTARSWDWIGNIQAYADPALVRVISDVDLVVETVRWEENRRGWGFAVLPVSSGAIKPGTWTGTADAGALVFDFVVSPDGSSIPEITYKFTSFTIGGAAFSGSAKVTISPPLPISNRHFEITCEFGTTSGKTLEVTLKGTFSDSGDQVSGTWDASYSGATRNGTWQGAPKS